MIKWLDENGILETIIRKAIEETEYPEEARKRAAELAFRRRVLGDWWAHMSDWQLGWWAYMIAVGGRTEGDFLTAYRKLRDLHRLNKAIRLARKAKEAKMNGDMERALEIAAEATKLGAAVSYVDPHPFATAYAEFVQAPLGGKEN